ncbi:MAG: hypothetical protein QOG01_4583 [Pseudonocardiales bacterium]|nr:hypothetical protein [Pseudonocardiales bacterium]
MTPFRIAAIGAILASLAACSSSGAGDASGSPTRTSPAPSVTVASSVAAPSSSVSSSATPTGDPAYVRPEIPAAPAIPGVVHKVEPAHNHVLGAAHYDTTPPTGGDHSGYWADCTGTVYPIAIANENAVHMLEHGAVWITYREGMSPSDVTTLSKLVSGQDHVAMSPYPGLKSAVSAQAWGYQLFVNRVTDPRIEQFITALRSNPGVAPELGGACSQPTFVQHPSTFGHPLAGPTS